MRRLDRERHEERHDQTGDQELRHRIGGAGERVGVHGGSGEGVSATMRKLPCRSVVRQGAGTGGTYIRSDRVALEWPYSSAR